MLEVIEVPDGAGAEMVRRVPETGSGEFVLGSQVIVRESQMAIFFRDGMALDTLGPGRHTLSTANLPLLGKRVTDAVFGESPFKAEVYFVNRNVFIGLKWGTREPFAYRDQELSLIRLRAHGEMAIRVSDPVLFVNKVVGARGLYTSKDIDSFLKSIALSSLAQSIGQVLESVFDLPLRYQELGTVTTALVFDEFAAYGTELVDFIIESISPPDEVQARIDERSGMGAVGNLESYLRYKSAVALGEAAAKPGSAAGGFIDEALGVGLGMSMLRSIQQGITNPQMSGLPAALTCHACSATAPPGSRFCPECGTGLFANTCTSCHQPLVPAARFCPGCGAPVTPEGPVT